MMPSAPPGAVASAHIVSLLFMYICQKFIAFAHHICPKFVAFAHQKDDRKYEKDNYKNDANYHILSNTLVIRLSMEFLYSVFISLVYRFAITMQHVIALCPKSEAKPATADDSISKLQTFIPSYSKASIFSFCMGSSMSARNVLPCGP